MLNDHKRLQSVTMLTSIRFQTINVLINHVIIRQQNIINVFVVDPRGLCSVYWEFFSKVNLSCSRTAGLLYLDSLENVTQPTNFKFA